MEKLPSVKVLNVSFARSRADVVYDPSEASIADMARALDKYGYTASPIGGRAKRLQAVVIQVEDFGGFDKVPPLEAALKKVPGVKGVRTDLVKRRVTVTVEPGKAGRETLLAAVRNQGMRAIGR